MSLRCRFGLHHWVYEKRGQLHQGSVYPALFRVCARCQLRQQEVYDEQTNEAYWADSLPNSNKLPKDGVE